MHNINARKQKSRETVVRFIVYGILGVVALLMTVVSVLALQGYDFDRRTGEVIQNGLILVNSTPGGANIFIDGNRERVRTPARLALPEGRYAVELQLEGYQTWRKTVNVLGSEVTWLFYPNFIPSLINTEVIESYRQLRIYEPSPDRAEFLVNSRSVADDLYLYSLTDPTREPEIISLPNALVDSSVDPDLKFIKWREQQDSVLLTIQRSEGRRYLLVDLDNPSQSQLISSAQINGSSQIIFAEEDDELLIVNDGNLVKLDVTSNNSTILARQVTGILRGPNDLVYILRRSQLGDELHVMDSNEEISFLERFKVELELIEAGEYDSQTFLLLRRGNDKVMMFRNPAELTTVTPEKTFSLAADGEADFSTSDRFIRLSDDDTEVYDLERALSFELDLDHESVLGWFDNTRIVSSDGQIFSLVDFDGANRFEIADGDPRYLPLSDIKADFAYSIGSLSASDRLVLQRSNLIAE